MLNKTLLVIAVALLLGSARADDCRIVEIEIHGMTCPFCVYGLEKELGRLDGVESVRISLKSKRARIVLKNDAEISNGLIRETITRSGFTPREILRGVACE